MACAIGLQQTRAYFQPRRGHCLLPLGLTPAAAIKNVFFYSHKLLPINGTGPLPFWRVISLSVYGMSTWAPCRLERSDVLVRQQEGNNEDMGCKALQTWSAPLSGAQQQGLECSADIVQALNPEGAGKMTEAREWPLIISRLESRISCSPNLFF